VEGKRSTILDPFVSFGSFWLLGLFVFFCKYPALVLATYKIGAATRDKKRAKRAL
jgi:hypothetical protein